LIYSSSVHPVDNQIKL